jgi:hypothetical protein
MCKDEVNKEHTSFKNWAGKSRAMESENNLEKFNSGEKTSWVKVNYYN